MLPAAQGAQIIVWSQAFSTLPHCHVGSQVSGPQSDPADPAVPAAPADPADPPDGWISSTVSIPRIIPQAAPVRGTEASNIREAVHLRWDFNADAMGFLPFTRVEGVFCRTTRAFGSCCGDGLRGGLGRCGGRDRRGG